MSHGVIGSFELRIGASKVAQRWAQQRLTLRFVPGAIASCLDHCYSTYCHMYNQS
jgi:hypothetical protein